MALARTHKGWENEHLATFLLSRIAFVASPVTVADDVGTDLFCTLYETVETDKTTVLIPLSSIAVQVKSSSKPVDVRPQLEYLARLEMPYYVGVVDQTTLTLDLYSGRFLPLMLSFRGRHKRLDFVPVNDLEGRHYRDGNDDHGHKVLCPKVTTLRAADSREARATALSAIRQDAAAALKAIASRMNKEYIFEVPGNGLEVFTGPDSATTFRENFFQRLAEALHNLAWLVETGNQPPTDELDVYLAICDQLATAVQVPSYLDTARKRLANARHVAA